ncbi:MAG: gliding motility-associated C-terminal domain-containing protein, partial [Flavobacteriales bacterium]|nr:gliding motility-associated C-terminal domain-containing protein [Flavobacteriales bacterium]
FQVTLTVTTIDGCIDSVMNPVESPPTAEFLITQNGEIMFPTVTSILSPVIDFVDASSTDVVWWFWEYDDGEVDTVQNPDFVGSDSISHEYTAADIYDVKLWVRNLKGCYDTIIHPLNIRKELTIFTPNSFSPNNDGYNDYFFPQGIGIQEGTFNFYIFDRWGDMVYISEGPFTGVVGWDGTVNNSVDVAQIDVFVWLIRTEDQEGKAHEYVGHVTLLR